MLTKGFRSISIYLFAAFLFFQFTTSAQTTKRTLRDVLHVTEKKFNVVFTFADEIIAGVSVNPPSPKATLLVTLNDLAAQTGLQFQTIGVRYIVISKPRKETRQTVCATLLSSETGEPVSGATITIGNKSVVADDKGYFEVTKEGNRIVVRSLGFESLTISDAELSSGCAPVLMTPSFTKLEEVTISDVVATGIEEKVDGSLSIHPEILGILPGLPQPDALQSLQYMPGVRSVAEAAADINIRGGTNDQNLVLFDGIKVYQTGHFFGLISGLNPHVISKVDLVRNGTSAYFGESTSGTINIQTTNQVAKRLSGGAGINMLYGDAYLNVPLTKKMSVQLAGRRSLPSGWQTPTYSQYFNRAFRNSEITRIGAARNQDFYFFDSNMKFVFDATSKDKFTASFFNVRNQLVFDETAQSDLRRSSLAQRSTGASFNYTRFWSDRVKTNIESYVSGYSLDATNQNIALDQQLDQDNKVLESGLRTSAFVQLLPGLFIQTGYQFVEVGITNADAINNPAFSRLIKEVNRTNTLFAEGNLVLNDERTNIRAGVRGNLFSKLRRATLEPRLVINQKLPGNFSAELLAEIKTQTTIQVIDLQSDFLGVEKRRWLMSNGSDVPMLKSRQVSTGVAYNNNGLLVSVDAFYKNVDGILTSSGGFQNQFQSVRSGGRYDIAGVELLANKKVKQFESWISYSLSKSNYQFKELIPPQFPNNLDIRHSLNGGLSARFNQFEISTGANWRSGRPTTKPVEGQEVTSGTINYQSPNSSRLKNYFRLDLSARWHFFFGDKVKSQLGMSLWNVLNRDNILSEYYQIDNANQVSPVRQSGLALTPNVFVRIEFD